MRGEWAVEPPTDVEQDPFLALIRMQDGILANWQASRWLSARAIERRIGAGRWQRAHRGIYNTYGGPLRIQQQRWIALLAATGCAAELRGAFIGGLSALQVHGLRTIKARGIDVLVAGDQRRKPAAGTIVRSTGLLPEEDRWPWHDPPVTAPHRSVVDAAAWAGSDDEARLIIAASFQQRLVSLSGVQQVLDRLLNVRRRPLILVTARDAASGSHSIGELDLFALCRKGKLPLPNRQVGFLDEAGRRRYLDAVFDEWRIAVEVDGAQHEQVVMATDDAQRQNARALRDYRILRFPVHLVRQEPARVLAAIRAALRDRGWRP